MKVIVTYNVAKTAASNDTNRWRNALLSHPRTHLRKTLCCGLQNGKSAPDIPRLYVDDEQWQYVRRFLSECCMIVTWRKGEGAMRFEFDRI